MCHLVKITAAEPGFDFQVGQKKGKFQEVQNVSFTFHRFRNYSVTHFVTEFDENVDLIFSK